MLQIIIVQDNWVSGEIDAIHTACDLAKESGARRISTSSGRRFSQSINAACSTRTGFSNRFHRVFKANLSGSSKQCCKAVIDPVEIKQNLIDQLTAPVKWTQSVQQMIALGVTEYLECGPGKTLQGLIKKIDRSTEVSGVSFK